MTGYVYGFASAEPALHPRDEACLVVMNTLLDVLLQSVCILLKISASMFIMDIGLKFSLLVVSLPGFLYQDDADLIK